MNKHLDEDTLHATERAADLLEGAGVEAVLIINHGKGAVVQDVGVDSQEMIFISASVRGMLHALMGNAQEITKTGETVQ